MDPVAVRTGRPCYFVHGAAASRTRGGTRLGQNRWSRQEDSLKNEGPQLRVHRRRHIRVPYVDIRKCRYGAGEVELGPDSSAYSVVKEDVLPVLNAAWAALVQDVFGEQVCPCAESISEV